MAAHHDDHELIEQLLRLVREHPELREALRRELLSEELLALPARVDQRFAELAQRIEELAARTSELADRITFLATRQERTEAGLARLDERLERLEARTETQAQAIAALLDAQQATERQLATLAERMAELADRQAVTEQRLAQLAARMDALTERMERVEAQIASLTARMEQAEQQIANLTARMERVEAQIASLTERMERVEAQIASLTARMERVEAQIASLTVRMEQVEQQIASLVEELRAFRQAVEARFQRVEDRLGVLSGFFHYTFYLHRLASILGHQVRRLRADQPGVLLEPLADRLGPAAYRALLDTDLIARGRLTDGREVWLVIEVSAVVDEHDVERALTRAALLRRAVPLVLPAVAGSSATEAAEQLAAESGVIVMQDGLHPALDPLLERWAAA
ncbi:hypothetical protein [Thermorudis peleae]|uniref:hypothetical protein n=1 Tax=Thermorudis peleae TaxID=1382356 RepID=UPI00068AF5C5|nr:hypothetical protein [Thermorudis peleae]